MKPESIILLSGGLDSTVNATIARKRTRPLCAMTFDYGQRAAKMEIAAAKKICRRLKIRHKAVDLGFFKEFKKLPMLRGGSKVRPGALSGLRSIWVPNRNALFINVAACFAEYWGASLIITGFNQEEAVDFPDNSPLFVRSINNALRYSVLKKIRVKSYTLNLRKRQIYGLGLKYGAPLEHVYSCYAGATQMCGECASCKRLIEAAGPAHV